MLTQIQNLNTADCGTLV